MTVTATATQRKIMTQIDLTECEVKKIPFGSGTYLDKTMRGFMLVRPFVRATFSSGRLRAAVSASRSAVWAKSVRRRPGMPRWQLGSR